MYKIQPSLQLRCWKMKECIRKKWAHKSKK